MPTNEHCLEHFVVANWGLVGANSSGSGTKPYRSDNPWQTLKQYLEGTRSDSSKFFSKHGAKCHSIDRGGSVWRIELLSVPTPEGLEIDEFAHALIDQLVNQITPMTGDHIYVSFASAKSFGHIEWTP